ncbi:MAG: lactate dehydrogenase [Candidatus Lokiarchaeota archaeon]|nr:lactate dehydrogenase [Candidatus Lokiarchaeota archaeon]
MREDKMKVIWCGMGWRNAAKKLELRLKEKIKTLIFIYQDSSIPLDQQVKDVNALIPTMEIIDKQVMDAAPRLKLIQQFGVGLEGIDIEAANYRKIFVANAPGTNKKSVAETAFYFMLALAKKSNEAHILFQTRKLGVPIGMELAGKILGIIGFGQSGIELARRAIGFEMKVMAIKQKIKPSDIYDFEIDFLGNKNDLDHLLQNSDYVSIHVPVTFETKDLIGEREFRLMKPTAYIINVSRGPIINKDALHNALKNKLIAGAGLDVFWNEPENPEDPLFKENVVTLPHVAGSTIESHDRMISVMVENICRLDAGEPILNLKFHK